MPEPKFKYTIYTHKEKRSNSVMHIHGPRGWSLCGRQPGDVHEVFEVVPRLADRRRKWTQADNLAYCCKNCMARALMLEKHYKVKVLPFGARARIRRQIASSMGVPVKEVSLTNTDLRDQLEAAQLTFTL